MRNILGVLIGLFIFSSVNGQEDKKWDYQLNFGATVTVPFIKSEENNFEYNGQIIDTEKINYASGIGYFAEFMTSYSLNSKLSLMLGVNYSNISFKVNSEFGIQENKGIITTSNIHFPLYAKYKVTEKNPISVSFGPFFRIIASANEDGTFYLDTSNLFVLDPNDPLLQPETDYKNNIKENYEKYDWGLSLQFDYEISISSKFKGIILTRFNYSLRNVINNQSIGVNTPKEWGNYSFDIGIGIKI